MKKILILAMIACSALVFAADDDSDKAGPQEQKLLNEEKKIAKQMFDLRVKLIKTDPALQKLHKKIMEMHKELALQLDSKKEMRELAKKLRKVQGLLDEIKKKKEDN